MRLLGSTTYEGKAYELTDVRGFKPISEYGYKTGWYGGRVDKIAGTDTKGLYLCLEGMRVIDILLDEIPFVEEPRALEDMTNKELTALLEEKGIEVPSRATKAALLELLS